MYVVGTKMNHLNEMIHLSTHNKRFIRKHFCLSGLMSDSSYISCKTALFLSMMKVIYKSVMSF